MNASVIRKSIFISLLGHLTALSIFTLSFGSRLPALNYSQVNFWGAFPSTNQINQVNLGNERYNKVNPLLTQDISTLKKMAQEASRLPYYYQRPKLDMSLVSEKLVFEEKPSDKMLVSARKIQPIIFHPLLPYNFSLYFKDRQVAHVELMFNVMTSQEKNSIVIKRRISCGNLEVDLLSMRYIGHYLFAQQKNFNPNIWQTVKIDLSAKND